MIKKKEQKKLRNNLNNYLYKVRHFTKQKIIIGIFEVLLLLRDLKLINFDVYCKQLLRFQGVIV